MREEEDGLSAWFEYNTDLFKDTTIQYMFIDLENVLEKIVNNADEKLLMLAFDSNTVYKEEYVNLDEIFS
jgi:hypothetical protein